MSTGPLTNHIGRVEKWGNGWISVRLPGVGLHNRRSFELYLHPDPNSDGESTSNSGYDRDAARVEVFDAALNGTSAPGKTYRSELAEDTKAPPTPKLEESLLTQNDTIHEVTPLTSCRVVGLDHGLSTGKGIAHRMSKIMFPAMAPTSPATIPESPVPESDCKCHDELPNPRIEGTSEVEPRKTKRKPRAICDDTIPLMQSLLFAQDGRTGKGKLDLLFGTAALERSRRIIRKPERFEETELFSERLKKRDRGGELIEGGKRQRSVAAEGEDDTLSKSTALIGPSDEESSALASAVINV